MTVNTPNDPKENDGTFLLLLHVNESLCNLFVSSVCSTIVFKQFAFEDFQEEKKQTKLGRHQKT